MYNKHVCLHEGLRRLRRDLRSQRRHTGSVLALVHSQIQIQSQMSRHHHQSPWHQPCLQAWPWGPSWEPWWGQMRGHWHMPQGRSRCTAAKKTHDQCLAARVREICTAAKAKQTAVLSCSEHSQMYAWAAHVRYAKPILMTSRISYVTDAQCVLALCGMTMLCCMQCDLRYVSKMVFMQNSFHLNKSLILAGDWVR